MHVVVVGAGVMGSAAAWQLAARGLQVTLLEQHVPGHTLGSSHGSSRIFRLAYPDQDYVRLALESLALWRHVESASSRSLLTLTGAVDHGDDLSVDALATALDAADAHHEILDPDQAMSRWPGLRFTGPVLHHRDAGRVDADQAGLAFRDLAVRHGATIESRVRVASLLVESDARAVVLDDSGRRFSADAVVLASGAWTAGLARGVVPGLPPLRVTVEQPVHLVSRLPLSSWPSFLHHGAERHGAPSGIYGLGSVDGVKIGGHGVGREIDPDRGDRSIDPDAVARLRDYAADWIPGVDPSTADPLTCLYTITPDHDFVVDRHGPITVLAGFSGHGFKFAPALGSRAADLVQGVGTPLARFALGADVDKTWQRRDLSRPPIAARTS